MHTTIISKNGICPKWKVPVSIAGKYAFSENSGEKYIARYMCATCPIVENSHLKAHEQNPRYKLMCCSEESTCPLMHEFPKQVDVRNGYTVISDCK